jgi:hypothetical protein
MWLLRAARERRWWETRRWCARSIKHLRHPPRGSELSSCEQPIPQANSVSQNQVRLYLGVSFTAPMSTAPTAPWTSCSGRGVRRNRRDHNQCTSGGLRQYGGHSEEREITARRCRYSGANTIFLLAHFALLTCDERVAARVVVLVPRLAPAIPLLRDLDSPQELKVLHHLARP